MSVAYGSGEEQVQLRTLARLGRRMGPDGPQWVTDDLAGPGR